MQATGDARERDLTWLVASTVMDSPGRQTVIFEISLAAKTLWKPANLPPDGWFSGVPIGEGPGGVVS